MIVAVNLNYNIWAIGASIILSLYMVGKSLNYTVKNNIYKMFRWVVGSTMFLALFMTAFGIFGHVNESNVS